MFMFNFQGFCKKRTCFSESFRNQSQLCGVCSCANFRSHCHFVRLHFSHVQIHFSWPNYCLILWFYAWHIFNLWFTCSDLKIVPGYFFFFSLVLVRVYSRVVHSRNRNEIIGIIEARTQQWFSANVFLMCLIYHRIQTETDQKKKGKNWDFPLNLQSCFLALFHSFWVRYCSMQL